MRRNNYRSPNYIFYDEDKKGNNGILCICKWSYLFSFPKGSQTMPTNMPPPRKLPQRSWAASIPTILTHSALNILLLPSPTPGLVPGLAGSYLCSPLERFLGSVIMRRHLQRIIQQETVRVLFDFLNGRCQRQNKIFVRVTFSPS